MPNDPRNWRTRRQVLAGLGTLTGAGLVADATDGEMDKTAGVVDSAVPNKTLVNMGGADYEKTEWLNNAESLEGEIEDGFARVRDESNFNNHWEDDWGESPYEDTAGALDESSYRDTGVAFGNIRLSFDGPFRANDGEEGRDTADFWQVPGEDDQTETVGSILTEAYTEEGEDLNEQETAQHLINDVENRHNLNLGGNQASDIANILNGEEERPGLFDLGLFIESSDDNQPDYGDLATDTVSSLERARDAFGEMESTLSEFSNRDGRELSEDARDYVSDLDPAGHANFKRTLPLVGANHNPQQDFLLREARELLETGNYEEDVDNGDGQIQVDSGNQTYDGVRGMNEAAMALNGDAAAATAKAATMHDVLNYVVDQADGDAAHYKGGEFDAQGEPVEDTPETPREHDDYGDLSEYCDFDDDQEDALLDWADDQDLDSYNDADVEIYSTEGDFTVELSYEGDTFSLDNVEGCGA